ncbi:uncharacterized protein LOC112526900 [Cynara cardunculus var. scolymus]|uniref:uncharacterized protein LOC112526900 n=1 Tax=Cynara cardunculus var. scolymus TaxID=59895 RepID=UPI000D62AA90|nr:uncharacterized protein LOC112526900 [Cynara cardunculus var. scolymus]
MVLKTVVPSFCSGGNSATMMWEGMTVSFANTVVVPSGFWSVCGWVISSGADLLGWHGWHMPPYYLATEGWWPGACETASASEKTTRPGASARLTNSLSQALQRKDEDILEAIDLIGTTKGQLQMLRENGFDQVLEKCYSFCDKYKVVKLDMAEAYVNTRNSRKRMNITNQHYYNYDIFNTVLDMQIREFGDRFGEISIDLLQNMAALNPCNSFSQFNKSSLLKLSQMYPRDFDDKERIILEHELDIYYHSIYNDVRFANLNGIADLARLMVATRKHLSHPLVHRLLKLTLVLPVATATVEICFSATKLVKTDLRNRIGDDFLNFALICAIEKEVLSNVKNEDVIDRFQKMKTR